MSRLTINSFLVTKHIAKSYLISRSVARWVAPTLRELKRRDRLLGPTAPQLRSNFAEWNYRAELFAFGKRLKEEFQLPYLQIAFTQRSYVLKELDRQRELGVDVNETKMTDNTELANHGINITREYVNAYLENTLPDLPEEGYIAIMDYLLSIQNLAYISSHIGTKELVFAAEYPPSDESLAQTLLAVIGALEKSSGPLRTFHFIRDFICTQLNQLDLLDIWNIENPEELLKSICNERKLGTPEPRLIGDCGRNTVLAAYHVGIYCNKEMIGEGYGEDVNTAIKTASLGALQSCFGIKDNMRPFNFQINVIPKSLKLS